MDQQKTAGELGIPEKFYDALIWTRNALDPGISDHDLPDWLRFDMNQWIQRSDDVYHADADDHVLTQPCGTAACIGGTMTIYMMGMAQAPVGSSPVPSGPRIWAREYPKAMSALLFKFIPEHAESRGQAVEAIDRFLCGNTRDPWLCTSGGSPVGQETDPP